MKNIKFLIAIPYILLGAAIVMTMTTGFGVKPDLHLWNWFGYEFGLDFSSRMPLLRIGFVVVAAITWFAISRKVEKEESKLKKAELEEMSEAA